MEYGQKVVWGLFAVTVIGVLIAFSQYMFPWPRLSFGKKVVNVPAAVKSISQPVTSSIPAQKPVPNVFYIKAQVALHNTSDNCWFILSGQVYDLSPLIKSYKQVPNLNQICGADITQIIGPLLKQYGVKDVAQLTSVLNQYAVGKVK